jgi:hypothetical protein
MPKPIIADLNRRKLKPAAAPSIANGDLVARSITVLLKAARAAVLSPRLAILCLCFSWLSIQDFPFLKAHATASASVITRIGNRTNSESRAGPIGQLISACGAQEFVVVSKLGKAMMT